MPETWAPDGRHFRYHATSGGTATLRVYAVNDRKTSRFGTVASPDLTLPGAVFSPHGR